MDSEFFHVESSPPVGDSRTGESPNQTYAVFSLGGTLSVNGPPGHVEYNFARTVQDLTQRRTRESLWKKTCHRSTVARRRFGFREPDAPRSLNQVDSDTMARVLCVGTDLKLQELRRLVLNSHGYETEIALPQNVNRDLLSRDFDVAILSVMLSGDQRTRILALMPLRTQTLVLETIVMPDELLGMINRALA